MEAPYDGVRGRWRINVEDALACMKHRKASDDLADAAVPTGTSLPAEEVATGFANDQAMVL